MPIVINDLIIQLELNSRPKSPKQTLITSPFRIKSEGALIPQDYELVLLDISTQLNQIPLARLVFRTKVPVDNSSDQIFYPGKYIQIEGGRFKIFRKLFEGKVIRFKIESGKAQRRIILEIQPDAARLAKGKRSQVFQEMSDSEIWEHILSSKQLSYKVHPTDLIHPKLIQYDCTDWEFLLTRLDATGDFLRVIENRIEIFSPNPEVEAQYLLNNVAPVLDYDLEVDSLGQFPEVKASSWNPSEQIVEEEVTASCNWDLPEFLSARELAKVVESGEENLSHGGNRSVHELKSWTENHLLRSRISKVNGTVTIRGFYLEFKPGDLLELKNFGEVFDGKTFITSISHHFSATEGWFTKFGMGMPQSSFSDRNDPSASLKSKLSPPIKGLQIGKVIQLENDPTGAFRIAVRIPILGSQHQEIWARMAHPDAGNHRGMIFYPEIGDEVVLGFLNEDPRDPIILGSLNSSAKPSPITPNDDNLKKGIVTRSGMKLHFDEDEKSVTIETSSGNQISVNEKEKMVLLSDQSGNRVKLDPSGVELHSPKSIHITSDGDVEIQGINIELKATATLKAEGSATAELSSSGVTKVKGSLIQIN